MSREVIPFLLRPDGELKHERKKATKKKPKNQEVKVADAFAGLRQPGSGSFDGHKGDVSTDGAIGLLVECKRTSGKKTIRVDSEWLAKITAEAHAKGKDPALSIEFDQEVMARYHSMPETTWVALPLSVMKRLMEMAEVADDGL